MPLNFDSIIKKYDNPVIGSNEIDPGTGLNFEALGKGASSPYIGTYESPFNLKPYQRLFDNQVHSEFGIDYLDKLRAAKQSGIEQFGAMISQGIIGEILGGTLEGLGYLTDIQQTYNILHGTEQDYGNWLSDIGKSLRTWSQETTPIYKDYKEGEFRPDKFSWWMSNGSFVFSTLSLLFPALGAVKGAGMLGKALGTGGKLVQAIKGLGLSKDIATAKWMVNGISTAMVSRLMENGMESAGKYDEIYKRNLAIGMSIDKAKGNASIAASDIWNKNWVMLAQDIPQYLILGKAFGKAAEEGTAAMHKFLGKSIVPFYGKKAYALLSDAVSEGGEEAFQYIVSENADYLSRRALDPDVKSKRLTDYFQEGEFWTSAVMGAMGSVVFQTVGRSVNKAIMGEDQSGKLRMQNLVNQVYELRNLQTAFEVKEQGGDLIGAESLKNAFAIALLSNSASVGNLQFSKDLINKFSNASQEELGELGLDDSYVDFLKKHNSDLMNMADQVKTYYEEYLKQHYDPVIAKELTKNDLNIQRLTKLSTQYKEEGDRLNSEITFKNELSPVGKQLLDLSEQIKRKIHVLTKLNLSIRNEETANKEKVAKRRDEVQKELLELQKEGKKIFTDEYSKEDEGNDSKYLNLPKRVSPFTPNDFKLSAKGVDSKASYDKQQTLYGESDFSKEAIEIYRDNIEFAKQKQAEINAGVYKAPEVPTTPEDIVKEQTVEKVAETKEPLTVGKFVDNVKKGIKQNTPEDLQFYENNKADIENELKKVETKKEEKKQTVREKLINSPLEFQKQKLIKNEALLNENITTENFTDYDNLNVSYNGKNYTLKVYGKQLALETPSGDQIDLGFVEKDNRSLAERGIEGILSNYVYDIGLTVENDKVGLNIKGQQYTFGIEAIQDTIKSDEEGNVISVTLVNSRGNKETFVALENLQLTNEIAANIGILIEARVNALDKFRSSDQHPVFYTYGDKEYKIYYDGRDWGVVPIGSKVPLKSNARIRNSILKQLFIDLTNLINNGNIDDVPNLRAGTPKEINNIADTSAVEILAEETAEQTKSTDESRQKGSESTNKIVDDTVNDILDDQMLTEAEQEERYQESVSQGYSDIVNDELGSSVTDTQGMVYESKKGTVGGFSQLMYAYWTPNGKELESFFADLNLDKSKAVITFSIDYGSPYAQEWWLGKEELKKKVQTGDFSTLSISDSEEDTYTSFIDDVPLVGSITYEGKEIKGNIYMPKSSNKKLFSKEKYNGNTRESTRADRVKLLTLIYRGDKASYTGLEVDSGLPTNDSKFKNVIDTFKIEDPNKATLFVNNSLGQLLDSTKTPSNEGVADPKEGYRGGDVFISVKNNPSGFPKALKLTKNKLSSEHAGIVFDVFASALVSGKMSLQKPVQVKNVTGFDNLFGSDILDLLVYYGEETKEDNPSRQLYHNGSTLYYGENNRFNFRGNVTLEQIASEKKKFVEWAVKNKNFGISLNLFGSTFDNSISVGTLTANKGDTYEGYILTNNLVSTTSYRRPDTGTVYENPAVFINFNHDTDVVPNTEGVSTPEKENTGTDGIESLDDWKNNFRLNPYHNTQTHYEIADVDKEIKQIRRRIDKKISIEVVDDFIKVAQRTGSKTAFGKVKDAAITLSRLSEVGTAYHEAFHIVSLFYLSDSQRKDLYDQARQEYNMSKATDKQIEEQLAEAYRNYVINNQNKPISQKIADFFAKLWNWAKSLFIDNTKISDLTIAKLFKSIERQRFRGVKVKPTNLQRYQGSDYLMEIAGFTQEQLHNITNALLDKVITLNNVTFVNDAKNIKYEPVLRWESDRIDQLKTISDKLKSIPEKKSEYEEALRLLDVHQDIFKNFNQFVTLLDDRLLAMNIRRRINNAEDITGVISYNDVNNDYEDDDFARYDKAPYEFSSRDNMLSNIKMFIATLPDGKKIDPYTGMPMFQDFNTAWSRIMYTLKDASNIYEMIDIMRIKSMDPADEFYKALLDGKINQFTKEVTRVGLSNGPEELRTQFQVSVMKHRYNFINFLYDKANHTMKAVDANIRKLSNQFLFEWNMRLAETEEFFTSTERKLNKSYLITLINDYQQLSKDVLLDYRTHRVIKDLNKYIERATLLLNKFKITVTPDVLEAYLVERTKEAGSYDKAFINLITKEMLHLFSTTSYIYRLASNDETLKKGTNINNVLRSEELVRNLALTQAEISPDSLDDTILGPDNNIFYVYSHNTYLTNFLRDSSKNKANLELRLQKPFSKYSRFIRDIVNGNKIKLATLSSLRSGRNATGYLDLTKDTDYLLKLNSVHQGYLPLPTLADRRTYGFYEGFNLLDFSKVSFNHDTGQIQLPAKVVDQFYEYALAEKGRIDQAKQHIEDAAKNGYKGLIKNYHYTYDKNGNKVFNGNALKYVLFKEFNDTPLTRGKVEKILLKRVEENLQYAKELKIVELGKKSNGTLKVTNLLLDNDSITKKYKDLGLQGSDAIQAYLAEYALNSAMTMIETMMLLAGDPAFYSMSPTNDDVIDDFIKRVSVLAAPGENYRVDYKTGEFAGKTTYNTIILKTQRYKSQLYEELKARFIPLFVEAYGVSTTVAEILADARLKSYKAVDSTDAQVYVSPKFYRELAIRIGEWSDEKQKAYDLLMSNKDLTAEEELSLAELVMQPLKPVYFNLDEANNLDIPTYDKMSMSVLMPRMLVDRVTGKPLQIKALYDAMIANDIDAAKFDSAVKVGVRDEVEFFNEDKSINTEGLNKAVIHKQKFAGLLRQQITDIHDTEERLLGTQLRKVIYSNLRSKAVYKIGNKELTGPQVAKRLTDSFKALSNKGKQIFIDKLGIDENGNIDRKKLFSMLRNDAIQANMPYNVIEALNTDIELDTLPDRKWAESRLISLNAKHTVDITTGGDAYIQVSNFGLHVNESSRLKLMDDKGRTEVMLSIRLFKNVIPNYANLSHKQRVKWLTKNFEGIGYRIPTQGQNSIIPFIVKEFLPEETGNMVILPLEITTLTGSDFDVDKIFLARYAYDKGGNKIKFIEGDVGTDLITDDLILEKIFQQNYRYQFEFRDTLEEVKQKVAKLIATNPAQYGFIFAQNLINGGDQTMLKDLMKLRQEVLDDWEITNVTAEQIDSTIEFLNKILPKNYDIWLEQNKGKSAYELNSKKAIENRLLETMFAVMTSGEHLADSKTPLDYYTQTLKEMADDIRKLEGIDIKLESLQGIFPKYQVEAKVIYTESKGGIAPFAISNVNHSLSQIAHLKIDSPYMFGKNDGGFIEVDGVLGKDSINILDWFSALLSAMIDVAKDPYIFSLNINPKTYNVAKLLIRAGVGRNTFMFLNQPLIKGYKHILEDKDMIYTTAEQYRLKALNLAKRTKVENYEEVVNRLFNYNAIPQNALGYTLDNYNKFINKDTERDYKWYATQAGFLKAYFRLLKPAQLLNTVELSTRTDTKGFGSSIASIRLYISQIDKLMSNPNILNFDKYFEDTFMGAFHDNSAKYMLETYSGLTIPSTIGFGDILQRLVDETGLEVNNVKMINKLSNDLFTSIVSDYFTDLKGFGLSKEYVKDLLFGDNAVGSRLYKLKEDNPIKYNSNPFLKTLIPYNDKNLNMWFINTRTGDRGDKWVRDAIASSWKELIMSNDDTERQLAKDLVYYSFYMSGFNRHTFSFYHSIPVDFLKEVPTPIENADFTQSYNDFIKQTKASLQGSEYDVEYASNKLKDVYLNNLDLLPSVTFKDDQIENITVGETTIALGKPGRLGKRFNKRKGDFEKVSLFTGFSNNSYPLFTPYVVVTSKNREFVWEYVGFTEDERTGYSPIYRVIDNKGLYKDGHTFQEYGLGARSLVATNNLKGYRSEDVIAQAIEQMGNATYVAPIDRVLSDPIRETVGDEIVDTDVITKGELSPVTEPTPTKTVANFLGYKGGYENKWEDALRNIKKEDTGKGTKWGDGKDEAMRQVADGFIGEIEKSNTSSGTSFKEITDKHFKLYDYTFTQLGTTQFTNGKSKIVMLARNSEFKGKELRNYTKDNILKQYKNGSEFVVGDMPNVDSQFIDYLQEIGAKFTIYHTGNESRLKLQSFKETKPTSTDIYNKLGDKTKVGNVVIESVYQKAGIDYAKSIGGIFSLRINNSEKHFGNPYSSVTTEIAKGLIPTNSTKESVERYIDWVINSQDERAQWVREQLKSGILKGKPIVYYKELGEPSHATALDYLINKYDWSKKQIETKPITLETKELSEEQRKLFATLSKMLIADKLKIYNAMLNGMPENELKELIESLKICE